jgi:hypothetical protein
VLLPTRRSHTAAIIFMLNASPLNISIFFTSSSGYARGGHLIA